MPQGAGGCKPIRVIIFANGNRWVDGKRPASQIGMTSVGADRCKRMEMAERMADGESRAEKVRRQAEEKRLRQALALRANLQRRKAQSRARAEPTQPADENDADEVDRS